MIVEAGWFIRVRGTIVRDHADGWDGLAWQMAGWN